MIERTCECLPLTLSELLMVRATRSWPVSAFFGLFVVVVVVVFADAVRTNSIILSKAE